MLLSIYESNLYKQPFLITANELSGILCLPSIVISFYLYYGLKMLLPVNPGSEDYDHVNGLAL